MNVHVDTVSPPMVDIMSDINHREAAMSSIIVRGLDEAVKQRIAAQAREHGRSMEAEAREILTRGVSRPNIGIAFLHAVREVGGVDLPIPERDDVARTADLG